MTPSACYVCMRPQIGADAVNPLTTSAFNLPERLAAKADPALIADDEQHFAASAESLAQQAVNQKLLHNGPVVAYREHRCLRAPSRPSPSFAEGHGEGRPESDTLKVSSSTSRPQPETRKTPRSRSLTRPPGPRSP
jgi:hypothetical protein